MNTRSDKILYIDPLNQYESDKNILSIHPSKMHWLLKFEKGTFDKAIVKNTDLNYLKSISLFRIGQAVKKGGLVEVLVFQPISVMQDLDAAEVEANGKLAGFVDVTSSKFEYWEKQNGKDVKFSTTKVNLIVVEKMKFSGNENQ